MFVWYVIRSVVRGRLATAIANTLIMSFGDAMMVVDDEGWEDEFRRDLARCQAKNPSVIKKKYYELYHSSNGHVYAYMLGTGKRRIY